MYSTANIDAVASGGGDNIQKLLGSMTQEVADQLAAQIDMNAPTSAFYRCEYIFCVTFSTFLRVF